MFPPLDTNGFDSFSPHQTSMLPSFTTHIQNPSSHPLPFSPAFLDESCFMNQFLLQQQDAEASLVESSENVWRKEKEKCGEGTTVPRTRTGKKRDRHSKICTAKGPRDRRMRLSLQIARKFFDLQDMLGFDKASKTIEWLISKSKTSIKQVKESVAASGSGGEGDSEHLQLDETAKNETLKLSKRRTNTIWESSCMKKESREKARERARERTVTKMKMRLFSSGLTDISKTFSDPNQGTRKNEITSGAQLEEKSQEQEWRSSSDVNTVEKFLGLSSDSSSSSIFKDSEESYTSLTTRGTTSTAGMVTPREHNTTSVASVDEERSPISFSLYDYLCY